MKNLSETKKTKNPNQKKKMNKKIAPKGLATLGDYFKQNPKFSSMYSKFALQRSKSKNLEPKRND